jgi:hypothetical protein
MVVKDITVNIATGYTFDYKYSRKKVASLDFMNQGLIGSTTVGTLTSMQIPDLFKTSKDIKEIPLSS